MGRAEDMVNTVAMGTGTANAENKEAAVVTVVLDRDSWGDTEMPCVANTKKQTKRERPANYVKYNAKTRIIYDPSRVYSMKQPLWCPLCSEEMIMATMLKHFNSNVCVIRAQNMEPSGFAGEEQKTNKR